MIEQLIINPAVHAIVAGTLKSLVAGVIHLAAFSQKVR
jgi:hypothetical protein